MIRYTTAALAAVLAAGLAGAPARAAIVYANNFDTENGGVSAQNYALPGFSYDYEGVDLVFTGDGNGVTCRGGGGGCLDLVARAGEPVLAFSDPYSFGAGDLVTLRYAISGTQRGGTDGYGLGFGFYQETTGIYSFTDGLGVTEVMPFTRYDLVVQNDGIPSEQEFRTVTLSFRATEAGRFSLILDGLSPSGDDAVRDAFGLIVDDLSLDISPVPEPATWAMMIAGFGLIGGMIRTRRRSTPRFSKSASWLDGPT